MTLVYWIFLRIFVLPTGTIALLADSVGDVKEIRRAFKEYLSGPAYERIENLPKISSSVIDSYASFGRLFLNGQLGACERQENGIFQRTWDYYDYLTGTVSETLKASRSLQTDLEARCRTEAGWVANVDNPWASVRDPNDDRAINLILHDVAPDCETADDWTRLVYDLYAIKHGFVGGDSNKCLQNFVIRYNNYDEKAYQAFVGELHKYLFQDLTLYGMCIAFSTVSDDERARRKAWVADKLTTVSSQLLKARDVLKEPSVPSGKAPKWWSSRLRPEAVPTIDEVHSVVTIVMTRSADGINKLPGKDRPTRYQALIGNVVTIVKSKYSKFAENGRVEGVMHLPYGESGKGLYCAVTWSDKANDSYTRKDYMGASYFIKWTENPTPPDILKSRIAFIRERSNEDITWNTIFNEYKEDMCEQVKLMMGGTTLTSTGTYLGQTDSKESSGFTAMIAVRCTNEFVWYELGWRYYAATATTASDYVVSRADGEYSNSCGQLIFLP